VALKAAWRAGPLPDAEREAVEDRMGPQEKRLTGELAVYLVRSCSRALQDLPPGATLDLAGRRRWFEQAYREWHLTPRVDLAGRSPYEVIAAERAARRDPAPRPRQRPTIELYTDLPNFEFDSPYTTDDLDAPASGDALAGGAPVESDDTVGWQHLADHLFGSWLDDKLDHL
jgi:hypothetical protein